MQNNYFLITIPYLYLLLGRLLRTQARSSGFESDWDFNFALGVHPSQRPLRPP